MLKARSIVNLLTSWYMAVILSVISWYQCYRHAHTYIHTHISILYFTYLGGYQVKELYRLPTDTWNVVIMQKILPGYLTI